LDSLRTPVKAAVVYETLALFITPPSIRHIIHPSIGQSSGFSTSLSHKMDVDLRIFISFHAHIYLFDSITTKEEGCEQACKKMLPLVLKREMDKRVKKCCP
jgi:hypothetical protein